jgi:hypothetical protein
MRKDRGRKETVLAVLAAGALAILVGSSAVRCAAGRPSGEAADPATEERPTASAEGPGDEAAGSAVEELESREWASADGSGKRMTARDGKLTETDGDAAYTSTYEVVSDEAGSCELSVTRADGTTVQAIVRIEGAGDEPTLTCEQLQTAFVWVPAPEGEGVEVTGVDQAYLDLVGGDEAGLERAVSSWCSGHLPGATEASFDGEVYLDTRNGVVTCTLTCDDPAQTVISVTWSDGSFSVVG